MAITIKPIDNKQTWEQFVMSIKPNQFLQSWNTGHQYQTLGEKIFRLGIYDGGELAGVCFLTKTEAKRGTYLFCPYGPLIKDWKNDQLFTDFILNLKELAKKEGADFVRINPFVEDTVENRNIFRKNEFKNAPMHTIAETLWILDITQSEEDILKGMRKNTRYLVRRAEKEGVKIHTSQDASDVKKFFKVYEETSKRHHFVPYSLEFLEGQVNSFKEDDQVLIYFAEYEGKIISTAIIMFYGDQGSYHHGASLSEYSKIPTSYLLQWEAIKEAKKRGCTQYNFWGIVEDQPKHPFAGISLFKKGFGGYRYDLLHCQDLPVTKKYYLTKVFETLRKKKRGF